MSTWMYQFWYFSFKTAKHWGRGPQDWTADALGFNDDYQQKLISGSSPNTPGMSVDTPVNHNSLGRREIPDLFTGSGTHTPSTLCRWSIHCASKSYTRIPSPPSSPSNFDLENEQDWPRWSGPQDSNTFTNKLSDNLASNKFSNIGLNDLPLATNQIAEAAQRSPRQLREEALGFSIMGGNAEMIINLMTEIREMSYEPDDLISVGFFPFHLAVSYLRGSKDCCLVLDGIQEGYPPSLRKLYINDLGHTILDQLMIAILKSHTSCSPGIVDPIFKKEKRFQGEDVDICGRWDADSDCVRKLLVKGTASIPFEWKHMFCHTSVQAICHCIGTIFGPNWSPDINTPSGLFVRRCSNCGEKLALFPLHTLILVGVHLSQSGCKDENLFGILACLLCLLRNGANPLLKASVFVRALLGNDESNECEHEDLDPLELAKKLPGELKSKWSRSLTTGWQIVCSVLECSQKKWSKKISRRDSPYMEEESGDQCPDNDFHESFFDDEGVLSSLWAAVQTELLTYRRLKEGDGWISQNFDLEALKDSLLKGKAPRIALLKELMMKPFCACGEFQRQVVPACPLVDEASAYYFANLEDWNRSNFIFRPDYRWDSWYFD